MDDRTMAQLLDDLCVPDEAPEVWQTFEEGMGKPDPVTPSFSWRLHDFPSGAASQERDRSVLLAIEGAVHSLQERGERPTRVILNDEDYRALRAEVAPMLTTPQSPLIINVETVMGLPVEAVIGCESRVICAEVML